jgi:dienelactone hydrolase
VDYRYVNYPGAVHAFTNPAATENGKKFNLPLAYHEEADKQSKAEMRKFLSSVFAAR